MKKLVLFSLLSSVVSAAGAAVISVENVRADGTFFNGSVTYDLADVMGNTTVIPSTTAGGFTGVTSQTMQFDISGLSIDGIGSADDSVSFSIVVEAWGISTDTAVPTMSLDTPYIFSTAQTTSWGNTGLNGGGNFDSSTSVNAGEGLSFRYGTGSVLLGDGGSGSFALEFDGFTGINYARRGSGDNREVVIELDGVYSLLEDPEFDHDLSLDNVNFVAIGEAEGTNGYFRISRIDFGVSVVAVPEPSAAGVLFGVLGLFSIVTVRRRIR